MATWLRLVSDTAGWSLEDSGQFQKIIRFLNHPCDQFPALVFLLGGSAKRQALQCLLPHNNTTRQGVAGIAKLHLNTIDTDAHHPHLFIDGGLDKPKNTASCNESARADASIIRRHRLHPDAGQSYAELRDYIFSQCILPYTHLLCIFADDLAESEQLISSWIAPSGLPGLFGRPRVVIVLTERGDNVKTHEIAAHAMRCDCAVSILDLRCRHELSAPARFEPLRSTIRRELDLERERRDQQGLIFSATHLEALMAKTIQHVVEYPRAIFDVMSAVREDNPVPSGIRQHLQNFLFLAKDAQLSLQNAAVFIASALVVDAYPPGMHRFDPRVVFRHLYADHCTAARKVIAPSEVQIAHDEIESAFVHFANLLHPPWRAVMLRRQVLRSGQKKWARLKTNNTCLFCILRGTCEVLPCGHAICEICIRRLGDRAPAEYHFNIKTCPICQASFDYMIRILPPTQRPNILVLDGGGIRGAISLGYLEALERYTGLRDFHLTVATSVGGLNAFYRILRGYPAEAAREIFKSFAHDIFSPEQRPHTVLGFVRSLLADGRYNSERLDSALAKALTTDARLYDTSVPQPSGSRVAVTASHVDKKGSLCVFANYRLPERVNEATAYELIAPKRVDDEPLLWQVARCAVAALGYFKPHHLPGLGTFQDGGVCANCPLRVALRESELLWPSAGRPNLVVSIGTGFEAPAGDDDDMDFATAWTRSTESHTESETKAMAPAVRPQYQSRTPLPGETMTVNGEAKEHLPQTARLGGDANPKVSSHRSTHLLPAGLSRALTRGYVKRAKDVFLNSPAVDSNQGWKDARDSIPEALKDDVFRLDLPLSEKLPELDDANRIDELSNLAFEIPDALAHALQTTSFFLELDEEPVQWDHMYHCQGSILCDKLHPPTFLSQLQCELPDARFMTGSGEHLGTVVEHDGCPDCGYYRKKVNLKVSCLDDTIRLGIVSRVTFSKIGGFPTSIQAILKDQQANAAFGRADHSTHRWAPSRQCYCTRGSKRRKPVSPSHVSSKRPRLKRN